MHSIMKQSKNWATRILVILFWLVVWQLAAVIMDNEIVLVGPGKTFSILLQLMTRVGFWKVVACSAVRILSGFFLGWFVGSLAAVVSWKAPVAEMLLAPFLSLLKAIPVASFVILALIWMGSENLTIFVVFVVVMPVVYAAVLEGMRLTDKEMLEMANLFRMGRGKKLWYIYRPFCVPFLVNAMTVTAGLTWKSGVAAEVIGIPDYSFGERLYMAKIYLETGELFAWTAAIILLSYLFERMGIWILKKTVGRGISTDGDSDSKLE